MFLPGLSDLFAFESASLKDRRGLLVETCKRRVMDVEVGAKRFTELGNHNPR